MRREWPTEIDVERQVANIDVSLELAQPDRRLYVDEQQPQEHGLHAHAFFCKERRNTFMTASPFAYPKSSCRTCVPYILNPDVGAGREEEPVYGDEQVADHVAGDGDADEEY